MEWLYFNTNSMMVYMLFYDGVTITCNCHVTAGGVSRADESAPYYLFSSDHLQVIHRSPPLTREIQTSVKLAIFATWKVSIDSDLYCVIKPSLSYGRS